MRKSTLIATTLASMTAPITAFAAPNASDTGWIQSWGVAQPLTVPPPPPAFAKAARSHAPATPSPLIPFPEEISDETVRMVVRSSAAGSRLRLELSNVSGGEPVTFDSVHVALAGSGADVLPGSDSIVTFNGKSKLTLFAGARAYSDPVPLQVAPLTRIAVSLHVPQPTALNTVHALGLNDAYIVPGDMTAAQHLSAPRLARSYFWLSGLHVAGSRAGKGTIVAFGDSITDGYATTPNAYRDWPDLLAARLQSHPETGQWGVINMGISGNRILKAGAGDSALTRLDEDVVARPGVKWVIMLEGINDINMSIIPGLPSSQGVTADDIIAGLGEVIDRAHLHGIKIAGGTITPTKGWTFYSTRGEAMRDAVNHWIRSSGKFDTVIDFDQATRDPVDPLRLRPEYDSGDHVHPNDAGNRAMAAAIDTRLFD